MITRARIEQLKQKDLHLVVKKKKGLSGDTVNILSTKAFCLIHFYLF